jgi:hypothetical protein
MEKVESILAFYHRQSVVENFSSEEGVCAWVGCVEEGGVREPLACALLQL